MKRLITGLMLGGLLLLTSALPALASQHRHTDPPGNPNPPGRNAVPGLERAAERRAEQAGDHGMEALEKQRGHWEEKGAKEADKARERMPHKDKMKPGGEEVLPEDLEETYPAKENLRDKDAMHHQQKGKVEQRMREREAVVEETAETLPERARRKRWYWPFGDAE